MKCPVCNRMFEPSDEEIAKAKEISVSWPRPVFFCSLPRFCSWECFKQFHGLQFKGKTAVDKEQKAKDRNRFDYHVGETSPLPGSDEARQKELQWREENERKLQQNPPKYRHGGFSGVISHGTCLPSQAYFGNAKSRVLDECDYHLGGEDGEKFNFEWE